MLETYKMFPYLQNIFVQFSVLML